MDTDDGFVLINYLQLFFRDIRFKSEGDFLSVFVCHPSDQVDLRRVVLPR